MTAYGGDSAVDHMNDAVGPLDRRQSVGNNHHCGVTTSAEAIENPLLDERVHRRGGIVENDEVCTCQERASEGDSLTLTARNGDPTFPDDRVDTIG